jgi:hypothetical protein
MIFTRQFLEIKFNGLLASISKEVPVLSGTEVILRTLLVLEEQESKDKR